MTVNKNNKIKVKSKITDLGLYNKFKMNDRKLNLQF